MGKYIILEAQDESDLTPYNVTYPEDIIICDAKGNVLLFNSFSEGSTYQEENAISGECIKLSIF